MISTIFASGFTFRKDLSQSATPALGEALIAPLRWMSEPFAQSRPGSGDFKNPGTFPVLIKSLQMLYPIVFTRICS